MPEYPVSADPVSADPGSADPGGGDPVCWLHQLCPECGAMPAEGESTRCWRCGSAVPTAPDEAT